MAAPTITITFEELENSPQERFGEDGFSATRILKCAWADRLTLAQQLKGGTISGTYYSPQTYAPFPAARVMEVGIANFDTKVNPAGGIDLATAAYAHAQLTVAYRNGLSADDSNPDAPLVEESIEPFAEFLTLPAAGFKWGDTSGAALKDEEAPGKLFKGFNWVYTRLSVTDIPSAVYSLVGMVNANAVHSHTLPFDFAAETLLYNPPLLRRQVTTDGTGAWSLEYRFSYKPQGWNRFWRAATQDWDRIFNASGPADPYETGDFTALL